PTAIYTDAQRLDQVLKNLLSNAFKFTERGHVTLRVTPAAGGWSADQASLNRAKRVIAISVNDSGIGIPPEKQSTIFEAFQQADGSTSRRFGGTGLALAISRELARLCGVATRIRSRGRFQGCRHVPRSCRADVSPRISNRGNHARYKPS